MLNRLRKLGVTKQDLGIISFLIVTFAAGLVIKYSGWKRPAEYDYTNADREFEQQLRGAFDELEERGLSSEQNKKLAFIRSYSDSLIALRELSSKEELKEKFAKKININLGYPADLQRLPGIGEVTAERIVEYRENNGGFKRIEDIMLVKGIGIKKFEKIKDLITVE